MSETRCPNCQESVVSLASGKFSSTCPKCQARLVVNSGLVEARNPMSSFADTPNGLAVGWPVEIRGRTVTVHGRIQYRYESGYWDEYHVEFPNQKFGWVSVDEGRYLLQQEMEVDLDLPKLKKLDAGDSIRIEKENFQVTEIGFATMSGMQGRLPFVVEPDEIMHYIALSSHDREITVEIFADESYQVFEGFHLQPDELKPSDKKSSSPFREIYGPPVFDDLDEQPAPEQAKAKLRCPECKNEVEISSPNTKVFVCGKCRHGFDLSKGKKPKEIFDNDGKKIHLPVRVGQQCEFDGVRYQLTGRIRYRQTIHKHEVYTWTACQLLPVVPGEGEPLFLENEDDHWTLFRPANPPTKNHPAKLSGGSVPYERVHYEFAEMGRCEITAIDGQLTWLAKVGDSINFADFASVPKILSAEWTKNELEWSLGTYMERTEVAKAFGLAPKLFGWPRNYLPHQPFRTTGNTKFSFWAGLIAGLVMVCAAFYSTSISGERIFTDNVSSTAYLSDAGYTSKTFSIPEGTHICRFNASSNSLNNQWVAFSFLFLDNDERVLLDEDSIVERYTGPGWSEGSMTTYKLVKLTGPKNYRIGIFGESGAWSQTGGDMLRSTGPPVNISLDIGVQPAKGWVVGAIVSLFYPVWRLLRYIMFESAKSEWLSEDED